MGFYTEPRTVQQAVDLFESLLDNLKKHQCAAALDWHLRNAFPGSPQTKPWGDVYLGILDVLAADKEVAVMTGRELCEAYFETASPWQATWMAS